MNKLFTRIALNIHSPQNTHNMSNNSRQIVIVGGGYASVWAYRSLVDELLIEMMAGHVSIKIVCPEEFHVFHGWTAECLAGIIGDHNRLSRLSEIFPHGEFIRGRVEQINPALKTIHIDLNSGRKAILTYDQLLLATGSTDSTSVEGLKRYAFQLKSEKAYSATKMQIQYLIQKAASSHKSEARKILRFTIAGCGFTGVEIASNLAELIRNVKNQFPALHDIDPVIYLLNRKEELLPGLKSGFSRMKKYTEKVLHKYGVIVLSKTSISRITNEGVFLSDGTFLESEMVISTIGQERAVLAGTEYMETDSENRLFTNTFLQSKNYDNIWIAGDISNARSSRSKEACPSNALWAIKQGKHAGQNMARAILNQSLKPFSYRGLGQCASLGIGKGIGEIYGIQFTGWIAWIMRWLFFQYFMPSKKTMWREISDWLFFLSSGRRKYVSVYGHKIHELSKRSGAAMKGFEFKLLANPMLANSNKK
jgi:NADH:ubiquinone reductase (H+-translocating)